ncbi:MAG: MotA/TolQ/ExbB proton channel family protein [Magnetococcales bacterium]|nr:MotA/TolQ/ExbB proton channel family protein [Magnetococcales bacterium]
MSDLLPMWFFWWGKADWIVRAVFFVLIVGSCLSWSIFLYKIWQFSVLQSREQQLNRVLALQKERLTELFVGRSFAYFPSLSFLAIGVEHLEKKVPVERYAVEADLEQAQLEQRIRLENGLTILATIGSSSPFIGLFGTVWGIMHALQGLGGEATLSMDMIAGPVSEALVATAVGLFTAIPAVMSYNLLIRLLRRLTAIMAGNALHIINRLMDRSSANREGF